MLKTKNLVPEVYYNHSRDFQFLGRTLDVLFNYSKMNADLMLGLPLSNNADDKMILLTASSLGFDTRHNYNTRDLKNICSVFADLVKNKGTKGAIERAVKTLMNAQNISGSLLVTIDNSTYTVKIFIPYGLKDLVLLEDLFDYILPAGYDYRFIYGASGEYGIDNTTGVQSNVTLMDVDDSLIGRITRPAYNDKRPDDSTNNIDENGAALTYTSKIVDGTHIEEFDDGD